MKELLTPVSIGPLTLKNRIVMAPTSMGLPFEERLDFLGQVADGGAALIYLGDMGVEPLPYPSDCSLFTSQGRDQLRRLTTRLHQGGAEAGAQLYLWDYDINELLRMFERKSSREEIQSFKNDHLENYVSQMPLERVEEIIRHFAEAGALVKELGFDLIQVLGGHVLNSFSSGYINHREDCFGGDVRRRTELAARVVAAIRGAVGTLPIEYKLAVHDDALPCGQGGPDVTDIETFVTALEAAGADAFQAALSNRSNIMDTVPPRHHPKFSEEDCFLYISDEIKRHTRLPVSCAGKLSDPAMVEALISSGRLDYAAMSRQLVADPQWVRKVAEGREADIQKCIFCNAGCLGSLLSRTSFHCVLHRS